MSGAPRHVVEDKALSLSAGACQAPEAGDALAPAAADHDALLGSSMRASHAARSCSSNAATAHASSSEQAAFDYLYDSSVAKRYALNTVHPTLRFTGQDVQPALRFMGRASHT
jgi:hypothetical protein